MTVILYSIHIFNYNVNDKIKENSTKIKYIYKHTYILYISIHNIQHNNNNNFNNINNLLNENKTKQPKIYI